METEINTVLGKEVVFPVANFVSKITVNTEKHGWIVRKHSHERLFNLTFEISNAT